MKWFSILCAAITALSCTKKIEAPMVLVMVDFSVSARQDLPEYQEYLSVILNEMPANSRLVVGKIGATTEATFDPFIDETFPDENFWTTNPDDIADEKEAIRKRFEMRCQEVFQDPTLSPRTNIVSALSLMNRVFPNSKRRILVLLSDMLHSSTDFDLDKANVTDEYIEATMAMLKQQDRVPRLIGTEIYVAGARAPTDERYRAVKKFWDRVFQEAGAQLKSYGHTLLNFKL